MPKDNESQNNEEMNILCNKILLKFNEIKYLNHKLDKFLMENFNYIENSNINEIFEKLEETEYYFDELIYNYEKVKPLINIARRINCEMNKRVNN